MSDADTAADRCPPRASLVPPDPFAGRRQSGPAMLMLLGLAVSVAAYFARGRLSFAPRAANAAIVVTPTKPLTPMPAPSPAARAAPSAPVDAFGSIGGPDDSVVVAPPKRDEPTPLRLQSIVIGPKRRVCMIDDRACVVGDTIDGATIESIGRAGVVVRRAGRDVVVALPVARP